MPNVGSGANPAVEHLPVHESAFVRTEDPGALAREGFLNDRCIH